MWYEGLGHRFVVSSMHVPLVGFEEIIEPFVLPYVVVTLVVRQLSILVVATSVV